MKNLKKLSLNQTLYEKFLKAIIEIYDKGFLCGYIVEKDLEEQLSYYHKKSNVSMLLCKF